MSCVMMSLVQKKACSDWEGTSASWKAVSFEAIVRQDTPDQSGRQLRKMKAGMSAWAQKNIARNDGLQWQSRSYHAIMHQVHTTWGKLH